MAHIIVVGNEKGGSGKSTTCMHVATALCRMGHRVGALDLDLRQKSFGRYIENRRAYLARAGLNLPTPDYRDLPEAEPDALQPGENPFDHRLSAAIAALEGPRDAVERMRQDAPLNAPSPDTFYTPGAKGYTDYPTLAA